MPQIGARDEHDVARLRDGLLRPARPPPPPSVPRPAPAEVGAGAAVVANPPQVVDGVGGEAVEAVEEGGRRAPVEHDDAHGAAEVRRRPQHVRRSRAAAAVVVRRVVGQVRDAVVPQRQTRAPLGQRHDELPAPTTAPAVEQPDRHAGVEVDPAPGGAAARAHDQVGEARADVDVRLATAVEHLDAQAVGSADAAVRVVEDGQLGRAGGVVLRRRRDEVGVRERQHGPRQRRRRSPAGLRCGRQGVVDHLTMLERVVSDVGQRLYFVFAPQRHNNPQLHTQLRL